MAFLVASIKDLPIVDSDEAEWILFEDFKCLLSKKRLSTETKLKSCNIFRWLKTKDSGVHNIAGKPAFSVKSVIHYFFAHSEQFAFCRQVTSEIEQILTNTQTKVQPKG